MKLKTLWYFLQSEICKKFYKLPNVLSDEESINYILENKCSVARYGDGELYLMLNYDIPFQHKDKTLKQRLRQIKTTKNCLVCVPDVFNTQRFNNIATEKELAFWNQNKKKFLGIWKKFFHDNSVLGDNFLSRFYLRKKDKSNTKNYVKLLKKLWQDRNIVFIEGQNSRLGYGNDLFDNANSIKRILCPSTNAFDKYSQILNTIKQHTKQDDLLILALGPTATVLAYDLSKYGYQALDLGHIDIEYEWFKMGVTEKCPVKNKHVNECNSLGDAESSQLDQTYLNQIICKVENDKPKN